MTQANAHSFFRATTHADNSKLLRCAPGTIEVFDRADIALAIMLTDKFLCKNNPAETALQKLNLTAPSNVSTEQSAKAWIHTLATALKQFSLTLDAQQVFTQEEWLIRRVSAQDALNLHTNIAFTRDQKTIARKLSPEQPAHLSIHTNTHTNQVIYRIPVQFSALFAPFNKVHAIATDKALDDTCKAHYEMQMAGAKDIQNALTPRIKAAQADIQARYTNEEMLVHYTQSLTKATPMPQPTAYSQQVNNLAAYESQVLSHALATNASTTNELTQIEQAAPAVFAF